MRKSSIRTTEKYKQAILEFPAPQSISDVRSWFGLINQVAYSFSMSSVMASFRPLLSPSTKFHWDKQLDEAFKASKLEIIRFVEEGVQSFEPGLPTCLSTDFSKSGLGWILQQKICSCAVVSPLCCTT